ncbi:MAG: hypothetical protein DWQ36_00995, partial [Acidobacteria bacterium]
MSPKTPHGGSSADSSSDSFADDAWLLQVAEAAALQTELEAEEAAAAEAADGRSAPRTPDAGDASRSPQAMKTRDRSLVESLFAARDRRDALPTASTPPPLAAGDRWAGFQIDRYLGPRGAAGWRYRGRSTGRVRTVELEVHRDPGDTGWDAWRLRANRLSRLRSPGLQPLLETVREGGLVAAVWAPGSESSLAERVEKSGPMGWNEALRLGSQVASALAALHQADLAHPGLGARTVEFDVAGRPRITATLPPPAALTDASPSAAAAATHAAADPAQVPRAAGTGERAADARALADLIVYAASGVRPAARRAPVDAPPRLARLLAELTAGLAPGRSLTDVARELERLRDDVAVDSRRSVLPTAVATAAVALAALLLVTWLVDPAPRTAGRIAVAVRAPAEAGVGAAIGVPAEAGAALALWQQTLPLHPATQGLDNAALPTRLLLRGTGAAADPGRAFLELELSHHGATQRRELRGDSAAQRLLALEQAADWIAERAGLDALRSLRATQLPDAVAEPLWAALEALADGRTATARTWLARGLDAADRAQPAPRADALDPWRLLLAEQLSSVAPAQALDLLARIAPDAAPPAHLATRWRACRHRALGEPAGAASAQRAAESPLAGASTLALAEALSRQGRSDEARRLVEQVAEIAEPLLRTPRRAGIEPASPGLGEALSPLATAWRLAAAEMALEAGDLERAAELLTVSGAAAGSADGEEGRGASGGAGRGAADGPASGAAAAAASSASVAPASGAAVSHAAVSGEPGRPDASGRSEIADASDTSGAPGAGWAVRRDLLRARLAFLEARWPAALELARRTVTRAAPLDEDLHAAARLLHAALLAELGDDRAALAVLDDPPPRRSDEQLAAAHLARRLGESERAAA